MTGSELGIILERFYVEARRQDGKPYQKSSILGIRAAIQRHLHAVGRLDLNIITGEDFVGANQTLDAFLKHLAKEGELQATQHKEPISKEDLEKLFSFFYSEGYKNPRVLTQAVWFFTTYHFGLRSREVQSNMKISHLLFSKIGDRECIKLAAEFRTKNHQGGLSRSSENACSDGQIMDPRQVRLVKFLLRKLHPDSQFLYMKPRADSKWTTSEDVWYTLVKLGHNPISQFLPQLSDHLSLSKRYTGHCVRVTTTQNLCNASIPNRHIMMITGHRQESSLQSYNSRSTERQRAVMSNLLDNPVDGSLSPPALPGAAPQVPLGDAPRSASDVATPSFDFQADLEEDDWDAQTVAAVSTVMDQVEKGSTSLSTGTSKSPSFGQGATFNNCVFHFG